MRMFAASSALDGQMALDKQNPDMDAHTTMQLKDAIKILSI